MDGITRIAESISAALKQRLPRQRKTQREKLALLIGTMLDVRSANLMDLAAGLPLEADRTDMRYQWIARLLGNPLVISDEIMEPFAREVLEQAASWGEPLVLILDQSKVSERHQVLMLALRFGERALPLAWRVEATDGAIGFEVQKALLEAVAPWIPAGAAVRLMGDRFYGTADLIGWCQERTWGYRLRLKGNLKVVDGTDVTTTGRCAKERIFYLEDVELTAKRARTHIGIIHDPGHAEPWIIAMSDRPSYLRTLEYGERWGIEPMFSDFKSRGFGIEDTQIRYPDRLDRLILVMALALYWAVSTGFWDAAHHSTPSEKKCSGSTQEGRPQPHVLVHSGAPPDRQDRPFMPAAPAPVGRLAELIDAKIANLIDRMDPEEIRPGHPRSETVKSEKSETVKVVETFRHFVHEGGGWRTLTASDRFVSGSTLRRWVDRWFANGTLRAIHRALVLALRSGPAAAIEAVAIVVDSCSVRAKHGGDLVGANPTDRGKPGTKYHVVTLTDGTPLGAVASGANVHDTRMFPHLLKLAQAVCASIGTVFADAGYDSAANRDLCWKKGVQPIIRRRGDEHGSGLGTVRHIVENANSWLLSNKRLDRRHDRSILIVQSLLNFACVYVAAHRCAEL